MMMMMMMMMILASVLIRLRNRKDGFVCTYELLTCDVCRITTNGITCEGLWYGNKSTTCKSIMSYVDGDEDSFRQHTSKPDNNFMRNTVDDTGAGGR